MACSGGVAGIEYIFGPIEVDAREPARDSINLSGFVDYTRGGAGVDYICPVEQLCIEGGAMLGGIFVKILE
jgi:hypothetical protein